MNNEKINTQTTMKPQKYKSPKCNPDHQDYSAKGNLPKGTKPVQRTNVDPMLRMRAEADYQK